MVSSANEENTSLCEVPGDKILKRHVTKGNVNVLPTTTVQKMEEINGSSH